MITEVRSKGFRGSEEQSVTLGAKTLIVGENGSGKTSVIYAAQLALMGYIPGQDKKNQIIHSRNGGMTTGATINGHKVDRSWETTPKGSVTKAAMIDGKPVKAASVDDMLGLIAPSPTLDINAFFDMSDRLRRQKTLELGADPASVAKVIADEEKARTKLKTLRETKKNAMQAVERLSAKLAEMKRPAGDKEKIEENVKECEATANTLREQIAKSDAVKATRKRCQAAIAAREKITADMDDAKVLADELKAREKVLGKEYTEICGTLGRNADKMAESIPELVKDEISEVIDTLTLVVTHDADSKKRLGNAIDKLHTMTTEAGMPALDVSKLTTRMINVRGKLDVFPKKLARMRDTYVLNKRKLTEADQAEKELAKLPESSDANEQKALTGITTRIDELRKGKEAIIAFDAISQECEAARIARDTVVADEGASSQAVKDAVKAQSELAEKSFSMLTERGNGLLPFGSMEIINTDSTFTLAWNTGKRVALRDSLCGYERVVFDGAVARAVGGDEATVFLDGGEIGNLNLSKACIHICGSDKGQVVITRWTDAQTVLESVGGWDTVSL